LKKIKIMNESSTSVYCDANCDKPWFSVSRPIDRKGLYFCSIKCYRIGICARVPFPIDLLRIFKGVMNENDLTEVKFPRNNVKWLDDKNVNFIEYCKLKKSEASIFSRIFFPKLSVLSLAWDSEMYFCRVSKIKIDVDQRFIQEYSQDNDARDREMPWSGFLSFKGSWTFEIARFDSTVKKVTVPAGSVLLWNGCLGNCLVVCDKNARGLWFSSYVVNVIKDYSTFTIRESDENNMPGAESASTSLCSASHGGNADNDKKRSATALADTVESNNLSHVYTVDKERSTVQHILLTKAVAAADGAVDAGADAGANADDTAAAVAAAVAAAAADAEAKADSDFDANVDAYADADAKKIMVCNSDGTSSNKKKRRDCKDTDVFGATLWDNDNNGCFVSAFLAMCMVVKKLLQMSEKDIFYSLHWQGLSSQDCLS
jgi:hypothetical protein